MAYSDTHLGTLPVYAVFRLVGLDRWSALQGWIATLFTANYLSACYFLRRFGFNAMAVPIGAYLFAFSLPYAGQLDHLSMLEITFVPAVFYFLFRWLDTLECRPLVGLSASFAALTFCYIYAAYLAAFVGLAVVVASVVINRRTLVERVRSMRALTVAGHAICLGVLAGIVAPLALRYWQASTSFGGRSVEEIAEYVPRPVSLILAPDPAVLWHVSSRLASSLPSSWEHAMFPGGVALASFTVALFLARHDDRRVWIFAAALAGCIGWFLLWTPTFSPYLWAVERFPFRAGLRAVSRVIFVELFLFSICAT